MSATAAATHPLGRDARKPTEIPAPGWKEIAMRVFKEFGKDRVMLVAAGTTFYLLLAMVPAHDGVHLDLWSVQRPGQRAASPGLHPVDICPAAVARSSTNNSLGSPGSANAGLGFALAISLGIALWSANAG